MEDLRLIKYVKEIAVKCNVDIADKVLDLVKEIEEKEKTKREDWKLELDRDELKMIFSLLWRYRYKLSDRTEVKEFQTADIMYKKLKKRLNVKSAVLDEHLLAMREEKWRYELVSVPSLFESVPPSGQHLGINHENRKINCYYKMSDPSKTVHILDGCGASTVTNSIELIQDKICEIEDIDLKEWSWVYYSPDGIATVFDRKGTLFITSVDNSFDVDIEYYEIMKEIHKLSKL